MALDVQNTKKMIEEGRAVLGIEFGSTRIKAVLINEQNESGRTILRLLPEAMTGRIGWTTVSGLIHRRISGRGCGKVIRLWRMMWRKDTGFGSDG